LNKGSTGQCDVAIVIELTADVICSLSATFFRNRIIGVLRSSKDPQIADFGKQVSPNLIFEHPTINGLAIFLSTALNLPAESRINNQSGVRTSDIEAFVSKYVSSLPPAKARDSAITSDECVVLLTGSTGNIGSHILAYLLSDQRISRVYTLNRPSANPDERLKLAFHERRLPTKLLDQPNLISLVGDVTQNLFGLDWSVYAEV
jgi:hypothetical protein